MRPATATIPPISTDFSLMDCGSVVLLRPMTETAREWLVDNVVCDPPRLGEALKIKPRYASAIVQAIAREGFIFS